MLRQIPDARFACSQALNTDQFAVLVESAAAAIQGGSGTDEFARVFQILLEKESSGREKELVAPIWAIENRRLLQLSREGRPFHATVTALSPSDGTVKLAFKDIGTLIPRPGDTQRRITNRAPNRTSVALWVETGVRRVLLGADLEHTGSFRDGWGAVLSACTGLTQAAVFKVPHHGSNNADCPELWTKMLIDDPIAVVTPFNGGKPLPQRADLQRLQGRTSKLYCTSSGPGRPPVRDPLVDKILKRDAKERRVVEGRPGHVRVRWSVSDKEATPVVELFNDAFSVPPEAKPQSQSV
jgi:hypothetical protein